MTKSAHSTVLFSKYDTVWRYLSRIQKLVSSQLNLLHDTQKLKHNETKKKTDEHMKFKK